MVQGNETEESSPPSLKTGELLASRYRIEASLPGEGARAYAGMDEQTQTAVIALEMDSADAAAIAPAVNVKHAHLAPVIEVVKLAEETGRSVVLAERVEGVSLTELLKEIGKKPHVDAVRSALRVADALATLHAAGGAHGSVNARTLIVQPETHAAPTLAMGSRNPLDSPYRKPGDHGPPSEADDTWATAALLYHMLTGHPPPADGIESTDELDLTELEDPALVEALAHGLAHDEALRSPDLRPLKRELARWFVDHASEEILPVSTRSSQPPPLPSSSPSQPPSVSLALGQPGVPALSSSMPAQAPRKPSRRLSLLAGGGILLGFAAAWGLSVMRNRPHVQIVEVDSKSVRKSGLAAAPGKAIDLSEVPVTGEAQMATGDKLATCVAGYLPKGAFAKPPALGSLCTETDPRAGGAALRSAVVAGAPVGAGPTDAMKIFARLGWYDMAAFSVIRSGCCPEAKPLALSAPSAGCEAMDNALRELGKTVVNNQSYEQPLKAYSDAISCEVKNGRAAQYGRTAHPQGGEESAFLELVKAAQSP